MVVRDANGVLRGFHNVCRHRARPLVDDGSDPCANLVCQYHGWAYAFDGRLRSARDFGAALDPDEFALHPVQVSVWQRQVFVNLGATGTPLEEDLGHKYCRHSAPPRTGEAAVDGRWLFR
jgi:choline monooxygenase